VSEPADVTGAHHSGHVQATGLRGLDGECADPARGAVDEYRTSRLKRSLSFAGTGARSPSQLKHLRPAVAGLSDGTAVHGIRTRRQRLQGGAVLDALGAHVTSPPNEGR
jgi:hypothetical protein